MTDVVRSLPRQDSTADPFSRMKPYADRLHAAVQQLLKQKSVSVSPFRNLARDILLDVREAPDMGIILPESGRSPGDQPISPGTPAESCVYTGGIQTARLIAWAASHRHTWLDRRELLTVAALLQDVGLLLLKSAYSMTPRQLVLRRPELFHKHPELGASLAGSITGCSVDLSRLIAQHHERLDGTGYPRQLRSRRLSETSRFLAIVVRFVELWHDHPQQDRACSSPPQHLTTAASEAVACQPAAERLFREALRGDWDLTLANGFLETLGFQVSAERMFSEEAPRPMALSRFGRMMLRIEPGHAVASRPHFDSRNCTALQNREEVVGAPAESSERSTQDR